LISTELSEVVVQWSKEILKVVRYTRGFKSHNENLHA
jgi:hypothetical protein